MPQTNLPHVLLKPRNSTNLTALVSMTIWGSANSSTTQLFEWIEIATEKDII